MLRVTCSVHELEEFKEVVAVGDVVQRAAAIYTNPAYDPELDRLWAFDQYAENYGVESSTITGRVVAIHAMYQELSVDDIYVRAVPGRVWLEAIESTAETRLPPQEIEWEPESPPVQMGILVKPGRLLVKNGDETLSGWVFTLEDEIITPAEPDSGSRLIAPDTTFRYVESEDDEKK